MRARARLLGPCQRSDRVPIATFRPYWLCIRNFYPQLNLYLKQLFIAISNCIIYWFVYFQNFYIEIMVLKLRVLSYIVVTMF